MQLKESKKGQESIGKYIIVIGLIIAALVILIVIIQKVLSKVLI